MTYKKINLSNDPWSEDLKKFLIGTPHYQTALIWSSNKNTPNSSTPYYQWLFRQLIEEGSVWNGILKTKEDVLCQCDKYKKMFEVAPIWEEQEIVHQVINNCDYYFGKKVVKIHEDGRLEVWDGMHRASILLALNMPIELFVVYRFPVWENLVTEVKKLYGGKNLYQPIPHPEFQDWNDYNDPLKENILRSIIEKYNIKSVLDLGTCHGFSLYSLKDKISVGTGVEYDSVRFKIAKMVLEKIDFNCYQQDIIDFVEKDINHYDCIFCIAVFHHLMKLNAREKFEDFLRKVRLKTSFLVYSLPEENEDQYSWMYEELRNDNIRKFIKEKTCFENEEIYDLTTRKLVVLSK